MTVANQTTVNYTETQTAELVNAYKLAPTDETVKAFAEKFGKSIKSIAAKLVSEKVYVPRAAASAASKSPTKAQRLAKIATALNISSETLASLDKGSVESIKALQEAVETLTAPKS
jgi:hypothetical protein